MPRINVMYQLNNRRSRKPEKDLCRERRRRLERQREIARREREQSNVDRSSNVSNSRNRDLNIPTDFDHDLSIQNDCEMDLEDSQSDPPESMGPYMDDDGYAPNHLNDCNVPNVPDPAEPNDSNPPNIPDALNGLNPPNPPNALNLLNAPNELNLWDRDVAFARRLGTTFVNSGMLHQQMNAVLRTLRTHPSLVKLPLDCRTLIGTPRNSPEVMNLAGGEYLHLGLNNGILGILRKTPVNLIPPRLQIDFSADGATLQNHQLWPIQIRIPNIPHCKPEVVGIWRGSSKPTDANEFFNPFVDEFLDLLNRGGVHYNGILYPVEIRCFIADAPARALILAHMAHNAYNPCSKCWIRGEWIRQGVMSYRGVNHRPRTGEEYANRIDGEHHTDVDSPLLRLPMNLVTQVPFEYMHSVCLGVMKKILSVIVTGKYMRDLRLSHPSILAINARLREIKSHCPTDFARKPEDIEKFSDFKATEFRQILFYTGPALLSGIVNESVYLHFLILHTAMRILARPCALSVRDQEFVRGLIIIFVNRAETIYGLEFFSYNIHALLHLLDDVVRFGSLDSHAAFEYENNMTYFRKACSKPNQQLQQIAKRCAEKEKAFENTDNDIDALGPIVIPGRILRCPLSLLAPMNSVQYQQIKYKSMFVSLNGRDDTVMLQDSSICIVQNIISVNGVYSFGVKIFQRVEDFFNVVGPSSSIGVFRCSVLADEIRLIPASEVHGKCFRMPYWHNDCPLHIPDVFTVVLLSSSWKDD